MGQNWDAILNSIVQSEGTRVYHDPMWKQKLKQLSDESAQRDLVRQTGEFNLEQLKAKGPLELEALKALTGSREASAALTGEKVQTEAAKNDPAQIALNNDLAKMKVQLAHEMDPIKKLEIEARIRNLDAQAGKANRWTPSAGGAGRPGAGQQVMNDADGNIVIVDKATGTSRPVSAPGGAEPLKKRLPLAERQAEGIADTLESNLSKMEDIARGGVTHGPIAGRISKVSQDVLGPSGPEGDFDFLARAAVDLVYQKSGKQINQQEMQLLSKMIPDRSRGHLDKQVELFKDYANSLINKYTSGHKAPNTTTTPPAAQGGIDPEVEKRLKALGY